MEVIRLDPAMKKQAANVYARAFMADPLFTYFYPDPTGRERDLAYQFEILVNYSLRYGLVYSTSDTCGVACWLLPGSTEMTLLRSIRAGFSSILPAISRAGLLATFRRLQKSEDYIARVQKEILPGPHSYLWAIAVDPSVQGKGVGKSLLKPGLDRSDEQGVPIYLETHNEKNVPFYQALGFDLVRNESLPGVGLNFWCMVRCPSSSPNKQS